MSIQVDDEQVRRMSVTVPNLKDVASDAARASDNEKNMSLWQSLKLYPKAVGWSIFLSMAIIMEVSRSPCKLVYKHFFLIYSGV